jgi:hypothetical protein
MDTEFGDAVRQRAHALWLEEGCPEGRSVQHWQQALHEVHDGMHAAPSGQDQGERAKPAEEVPTCLEEETDALPRTESEICSEPGPVDLPLVSAQPLRKGTSLFKVSARQCRFIVSETSSPTLFCAAPTAGGSWCQEHQARVFVRSANPLLRTGQKRSAG